MLKQNFNHDWTFYNVKDKAEKVVVNLPHDAMQTEKRIPKLKDGAASGYYPGGKYVYTKTLFGDQEFNNKTLILEFEGVYQKSRVYLNGQEVGGRIYGYSNFYVDLTDKLLIGQSNEIKVVVDNTQTPNSRWYSGSGIYRDVNLYSGNKHHIELDGVRIVTKSIRPAVLEVEVKASQTDGMEITTKIIKDGKTVAVGSGEKCEITVPGAQLWDVENPYLYDVQITLSENGEIIDEVKERTGIRQIAWNAEQGFQVNGKSVKLRGGNVHHDHGPLGACSFEKAEYRRIKILKDLGFNAVRYAHYPANKAFLDACDELGMYVMNETFDTWHHTKSAYDYGLYFHDEWEKDITAMVLKSVNHPSVIMYSIGNEISSVATQEGAKASKAMANLCRKLDSTRPVTNGINFAIAGLGSILFKNQKSEITPDDIVNPYREGLNSLAGASVLFNVVMTLIPRIMNNMSKSKRAAKKSEESLGALDIVGVNYGEKAYEKHHEWYPERVMVGTESFPPKIAQIWKQVEELPYLVGDFMWSAWDYLGEAGIGVPLYGQNSGGFSKPYPCISAGCGVVDMTGFVNSSGYYAAVIWNQHKTPYIGVRPINRSGEKVAMTPWGGTDSVNSWSWSGQEGRQAEIEVFSIGDSVELVQDGKSLGKHKLKDSKAEFEAVYHSGELVAISYNAIGQEIARSSLKSAAKETGITLIPEDTVFKADGHDLVFIPVHFTDQAGITKLLDDRTITVDVEGAGTLAAVGSGNPWTEEPFTGNSYTTYQGRMIAIVRSNGEKGEVKVRVSSSGLESQEITLKAI